MDLFRVKSIDSMMAQRQTAGLRKSLSTFDLVMLGVGAVVGSGIFILTGTGSLIAGPALSLSFVLAAIACFFSALSYAEFSSSLPVSGSVYTYVYATLGELPAWLIGWILILEFGLAASAVAAGWSGYLQSLIAGFGLHLPEALRAAPGAVAGSASLFNLPAFLVLAAITALLSLGIRQSKRVNNAMVVIKILVVVLFIAAGATHVRTENWTPFMPYGMSGVYAGAALMFYAFIGFDAVASSAEEVRNPQRSLPLGILGSLLICTVLYVLVTLVMTGIVSTANKLHGRERVRMAAEDAAMRGIQDGDLVKVYNDRGACIAAVSVQDGVMPAVAIMSTGAWFDPLDAALERHGNPNVLTLDAGTSRLAQAPSALSALVEIRKWEGEAPRVEAFEVPAISARAA